MCSTDAAAWAPSDVETTCSGVGLFYAVPVAVPVKMLRQNAAVADSVASSTGQLIESVALPDYRPQPAGWLSAASGGWFVDELYELPCHGLQIDACVDPCLSSEQVELWLQHIESRSPQCTCILQQLSESPSLVLALSFQARGCRLVQAALEAADTETAARLGLSLHGCVRSAIICPHGNHVVQKIVQTLSNEVLALFVDELSAMGVELASHKYGCRVFCRLLEYVDSTGLIGSLVDEVLGSVRKMILHPFGHYVVERILLYGSTKQRHRVIEALCQSTVTLAANRGGAHVLETALEVGSFQEQRGLVNGVLAYSPPKIASLVRVHLGCGVLKALLRLPSPLSEQLREHLAPALPQLQASKRGKELATLFFANSTDEICSTCCTPESPSKKHVE